MDERIEFTIRPFGLEETKNMTAISADVGWNQPEEEIRHIIRRSGKYLLGAFRGDALVGVAASYPYPDGGFAYVNEVIVSSTWRKRGAATQLLEKLLPLTAADYPVLRLCATAMGRPIYEKFGFKPFATVSFGEETGELAVPESSGFAPMRAADLPEAGELDAANTRRFFELTQVADQAFFTFTRRPDDSFFAGAQEIVLETADGIPSAG